MGWLRGRGGVVMAALLGLAVAAALLFYLRPELRPGGGRDLPGGLSGVVQGVQEAGKNAAQTVAQLFSLRSPGERASGVLASLKGKKKPALHARVLPKVRRAPPSAYPYVAAPPPAAAVIPPAGTPLFNTVTSAPPVPVAASTVPGGPGGSPIFPALPSPPGGGFVVPPPILPETPGTPGTPGVPAVPEPASWAMMLVGFALVGGMLRRGRHRLTKAALPRS